MDGLAPAIAIKQKNQTRNPRSTVATATEIYDYLRLLYARCGTVTCLHCGGIVRHDTVDEIVSTLLALGPRENEPATRAYALFPLDARRDRSRAAARQPPAADAEPALTRTAKRAQPRNLRSPSNPRSVTPPAAVNITETSSKSGSPNSAAAATTASTSSRPDGDPQPHRRVFHAGERSSSSTFRPLPRAPSSSSSTASRISPEVRSRIVDAIETGYRESGEVQFHDATEVWRGNRRREQYASPALLRRLRVLHLPSRLPRARAAPLLLQQSLRRLPPLPGLRQHHRLRPGPHHPGQVQASLERQRHRPLEPVPSTAPMVYGEMLKRIARVPDNIPTRRSLVRPHRPDQQRLPRR